MASDALTEIRCRRRENVVILLVRATVRKYCRQLTPRVESIGTGPNLLYSRTSAASVEWPDGCVQNAVDEKTDAHELG